MADQPVSRSAKVEHLAEVRAELLAEAREARARAKAERERAAQVLALSRQAWERRHRNGPPGASAAREPGPGAP